MSLRKKSECFGAIDDSGYFFNEEPVLSRSYLVFMESRFAARWVTLVLVFACGWLTPQAGGTAGVVPRGEYVVLLHGLGRSSLSMKRLEWRLQREGYEVVNVSYPSRSWTVEQLAAVWLPRLLENRLTPGVKTHFVTHSMGGIVLRAYLCVARPERLGRVVMLGPPNAGSELVDRLSRNAVLRKLIGPAGQQLGTSRGSAVHDLPPADFEVGILAGNRSCNPVFSALVEGPDDGKVSVSSTRLEGMTSHRVVPCSHTWLMWRTKALNEVICFLDEGHFTSIGGGR